MVTCGILFGGMQTPCTYYTVIHIFSFVSISAIKNILIALSRFQLSFSIHNDLDIHKLYIGKNKKSI